MRADRALCCLVIGSEFLRCWNVLQGEIGVLEGSL